MRQDQFEALYGLSQDEKDEMVKRLSQDITFQDESTEVEYNKDEESQDETSLF